MKIIKRIIRKITINKKNFNSANYWEERYADGGNSGAGSYNRLAEFKAEILNDFCNHNEIQKVIEFGCGDGNQLSLANYKQYIGYDVSEKVIETCKEKFKNDNSKDFFVLQNTTQQNTLQADLTISLDVIFHLVEDNVFETYMKNLFSASTKYVIIYSSNYDSQSAATHVKHRCFTEYINQHFQEFSLINSIKNRYPFDKSDPDNTSFADFYFFEKR